MATDLSRNELQRLARLGAEQRLAELRQEEAAILAAFPDLARDSAAGRRGARGRGGRKAAAGNGPAAAKRRRRRSMSAAERKAVSDRMKKYWAARRKAKE